MVNHFFSVANHRFVLSLSTECEPLFEQLAQNYSPFRVDVDADVEVLFELSVELGDALTPTTQYLHVATISPQDWGYDVWRNAAGDHAIVILDSASAPCSLIYADARFRKARVVIGRNAAFATNLLNGAIIFCYAFAGAYRQLLLVHAAAPQKGDIAFLFQGKSGTGKSTHAQLWLTHIPQTALLNDDNPVVEVAADGQVYVWGTPWSGKTPCYRNVRCQLGGLLRLQQAPENEIHRQSPTEAFASLLSSCSTMIWDKASYDCICATVEQIVTHVSSYHLRCLPEEAAAKLSYNHLSAAHHGR